MQLKSSFTTLNLTRISSKKLSNVFRREDIANLYSTSGLNLFAEFLYYESTQLKRSKLYLIFNSVYAIVLVLKNYKFSSYNL